MKKALLFTLFALVLIAAVSAFAFAIGSEEPGTCTVTFKAEFTTPVEFPDGSELFGKDLTSSFELEKNCELQDSDIPVIMFIGDAVFEGWDKEPHGCVVTEDVTFTAKINNDGTMPAFFRAADENNEPFGCLSGMCIDGNTITEQPHIVSFCKTGEKLAEGSTIPVITTVQNGEYVYILDSYDTNPVDYVMNEPKEFTCKMKPVFPEDVPQYYVRYKVEFTSGMTMPEGYENSMLSMVSKPYLPGSIIEPSDVPTFRYLGDGLVFEGWDKEPAGAIVTGSMTFTARFNDEGAVAVFFKAVDEDGEAIQAFANPENHLEAPYYRTYITVVKKGETLNAHTVPKLNSNLGYLDGSSWDAEPIGYIADETHEFTFTYKYFYRVNFIAEPAKINVEQYVHRGEAAIAPEVPEVEGYLFIGWDKDFSNITKELTVNALMFRYGDANMDYVINTADAVEILKHCAGIKMLEGNALKLADANSDTKVNTSDAVKVLRIAAGMEK